MQKEDRSVLIVVDVQNDFCPGGGLAVAEGDRVVPVINELPSKFERIVATQDWHPGNHISFATNNPGSSTYDLKNINGIEQVLWPEHCIQGTKGAEFHPDLLTDSFQLIVRKGWKVGIDSYSAFIENDRKTITGLEGYLSALCTEHVFICGLATDYCVYFSALDCLSLGYKTSVVIDACRGVDSPEGNVENSIADMKAKGVRIINSGEL